ncbi:hypothetical protein P9D43_27145 [Neobacillus niacini]|nr:hypothetical protein [Neobacillus niacini]MEC1525684.1 hypothetical protein [Neobacillus niacini]
MIRVVPVTTRFFSKVDSLMAVLKVMVDFKNFKNVQIDGGIPLN